MLAQSIFPHKRIEQLATLILMERKITATEQRILSDALFSTNKLDEEEIILVSRVFYGIRHGLLTIVEEIG